MLQTDLPNHLRSWNSFSFVLKVNKIGQQCKYFYSRKRSQTHRCIAEAERGGNMVLASEEACAMFQPSRSFKFNLSPNARRVERVCELYMVEHFKRLCPNIHWMIKVWCCLLQMQIIVFVVLLKGYRKEKSTWRTIPWYKTHCNNLKRKIIN